MALSLPRGATLLELVIALTILSGLALASAPVAARSGLIQARGRALVEGSHLATTRTSLSQNLPCLTTSTGTDTSRRARLSWSIAPADSALLLTSILSDPGSLWPAETLSSILPCTP